MDGEAMNIVVCVKQVPEIALVRVTEAEGVVLPEGPGTMNPFDEYAVEEGLRLKEKHGGTVTVMSCGDESAASGLRAALALGVDRGVHLIDAEFLGSDGTALGLILAAGIRKIGDVDLCLFGKNAVDTDRAVVPAATAGFLEWPQALFVKSVESVEDGRLTVLRMTDAGADRVGVPLPAVISVIKEINEPRLPSLKGKMGIAISPADPRIVYMAIEAKDGQGGVYRSNDAGESFSQVSDDARTWARAWYYMHIIADPRDEDEVWVLNSAAMRSIDGGATYTNIPASHVDHHALWINPENSDIMINGNDGGASVTWNGGETWSSVMNQPTAQMYRVTTDNQYPYRVYSGQQDASGIVIDSRTLGNGIGVTHWTTIRSGESATVGLDPEDPKFVYTTFFASFLGEWNRDTHNYRMIRPYPERVTGEQPKNLKYRANWNGPVAVSPHDPGVIYYGSQYLMKSTDRGMSWEVISPDLTRNDKEHQGPGGYPISNEQITAESYNNLFNIEESLIREGVIWVGSDDGLVHVTQDGGQTWTNVTPDDLPESIINVVEPSPHDPATAYFAAAGYKMNDFTPYLYKTNDYGASWQKIVNGIPGNTFARSIREDPDRRGLLYAGTETGMFISFDDGGI
ncbi:MAG: hypothetical protein IIA44_02815 [Acidobacteria bacterium]|nr:hypothetical protein [Acidobacteriota bacterium]